MDELCRIPTLPGTPDAAGVIIERLRYRVFPRPKPKFKTTIDARALLGEDAEVLVETRLAPDAVQLRFEISLANGSLHDTLDLDRAPGMRARVLNRVVRDAAGAEVRAHTARFGGAPYHLPATTYPETMTPFIMRGQPRDKIRRSLYCWTNDGFCARVYYEYRGLKKVSLKDGTQHRAHEVWMYPDLNDWIAMGAALTRLAKPLLPRYTMWYEADELQRLLRFEGPYGPPGAPEVIVELAGEA